MRIAFTGGGTGGHLYPIIAVAREIRKIAEEGRILGIELYYFGPEELPAELGRTEEIIFARIPAGKIRRYFSFQNFIDLFRVGAGILIALVKMFMVMPDVVLAKGGYGSFPTLIAARLYRIPVVVHESDAVPGRVNVWAGKWASRVAIAFPGAARHFAPERAALTGIPVRWAIVGGEREAAREVWGVYSGRPVLFFIGGSQGAFILNRTLISVLANLLQHYEIIHQTGEKNFEDVRLETASIIAGGAEPYYHPAGFLSEEQMRSALALADLLISRAGATAIYEIAAGGKPSILIPLQNAAQDHQRENAYQYAKSGAAVVIEEDNFTPSVLTHEIATLMADRERRAKMGEAARAFARPDAASVIAQELLTLGLH